MKWIAKFILWIFGWKIPESFPEAEFYKNKKKAVLVFAPHTSNWDFVWGQLGMLSLGIHMNWAAKDSLFVFPLGVIMRLIGGIPVNRRFRTGFTENTVSLFRKRKKLLLAIAPEGSRSKENSWRSGFYHIARGADIPILLSYMDYAVKEIGFSVMIAPSQDINKVMEEIRFFYQGKTGKYPQKQNEIRFD